MILFLWLSPSVPVQSQSIVAVSMELSPQEATITQASARTQIATVTLNLVAYAGTEPLTCTLSSSGQPSGVDITFEPNPVNISEGTVTSAMIAVVSLTAPTGDFTLTVTAMLSNGAQDSGQFHLRIVARCIIATAAYGSELSAPVQFLRVFRDQVVMRSYAGSEFLKVFNIWYYSFSPSVAHFISQSSLWRALTRVFIYPLIGILKLASSIHSMFSFNPEVGVVVSGFSASALIGTMYLGPPLSLVSYYVARKRGSLIVARHLKTCGIMLVAVTCAMFLAEIVRHELLMMIVSASFVVVVILSAGVVLSTIFVRLRLGRSFRPRR